MRGWGDTLTERDRWHLVNYLRTLPPAMPTPPARRPEALPDPGHTGIGMPGMPGMPMKPH